MILTLAAIEDVDQTASICLDDESPKDSETGDSLRKTPITSGFASAFRHLRARGGIRSCFRGLGLSLAVTVAEMFLASLASVISPLKSTSLLHLSLVQFVSCMPLATWQMACVHRMIADKSPRTKHRRMVGYRYWPRIAPAAALFNSIVCVTTALSFFLAESASWVTISLDNPNIVVDVLFVTVINAFIANLLSLPAQIICIRVAASMLPEEDEAIVPFDPLFGGKVDPNVVDRSSLGIADAWKTFKWPARVRYLKLSFQVNGSYIALGALGSALALMLR